MFVYRTNMLEKYNPGVQNAESFRLIRTMAMAMQRSLVCKGHIVFNTFTNDIKIKKNSNIWYFVIFVRNNAGSYCCNKINKIVIHIAYWEIL